MTSKEYDIAIIGGGFYGCCLALYLRSLNLKIIILESEEALMTRASRVNQARVHTGFHYPRSFVTAIRSAALQSQFSRDFTSAVVDDFTMLYAIARQRSKVSANRFLRTFDQMGAPIKVGNQYQTSLFEDEKIEGVFECREWAFDWSILRSLIEPRLVKNAIDIAFGSQVECIHSDGEAASLSVRGGANISTKHVFNITYSNINHLLKSSGIAPIGVKHEITEVALITPPPEMAGIGVTVMDGPFFSVMPYPSKQTYSLTHVRYTPHLSWLDKSNTGSPNSELSKQDFKSRWYHMKLDAQRYMPCLADLKYNESLYEVKTVLLKNEYDDGRPIFFRKHQEALNVISVMGAKIDNIYDLFETIKVTCPQWSEANDNLLVNHCD